MNAPPPIPSGPAGPVAPPPKTGLSGCAIAAIIGAVLLVFGVFLAGMLAAIAVPAYQDYTTRARAQGAYLRAQALQETVDVFRAENGRCPANADVGLDDPETVELGPGEPGRPLLASLHLETSGLGHCVIRVEFANLSPAYDGRNVLYESVDGAWICFEGSLPAQHRPPHCRGDTASP